MNLTLRTIPLGPRCLPGGLPARHVLPRRRLAAVPGGQVRLRVRAVYAGVRRGLRAGPLLPRRQRAAAPGRVPRGPLGRRRLRRRALLGRV